MSFSIDFSRISLDQYREQLLRRNLIPSRMILKDEADTHFNAFKNSKIETVEELFFRINNKKAKTELLQDKNINDKYLDVLLRELKSVKSKPLKLKEFSWISSSVINKIENTGILNTQIMYEKLGKAKNRAQFLRENDLKEKDIIDLLKLSDLTRIQWVNSTFAHVLFASGFDTVEKVSKATYEDLYRKVMLKNEEIKLYKGKIGLNDMKLCIEAAGFLDIEIEVD